MCKETTEQSLNRPNPQLLSKQKDKDGASIPKLTYFSLHAKGEPIRMLLHKAGVQFEDNRLTFEQFGELKTSGVLPNGQVPIFEYQGRILTQSNAILRLLGRQHGFYLEDDSEESFLIDWALETSLDLWASKAPTHWYFEKTEEENAAAIDHFAKFNQ